MKLAEGCRRLIMVALLVLPVTARGTTVRIWSKLQHDPMKQHPIQRLNSKFYILLCTKLSQREISVSQVLLSVGPDDPKTKRMASAFTFYNEEHDILYEQCTASRQTTNDSIFKQLNGDPGSCCGHAHASYNCHCLQPVLGGEAVLPVQVLPSLHLVGRVAHFAAQRIWVGGALHDTHYSGVLLSVPRQATFANSRDVHYQHLPGTGMAELGAPCPGDQNHNKSSSPCSHTSLCHLEHCTLIYSPVRNSESVSLKRNPTTIMSMRACESSPNLD
uniref:Uncharacterized protein n=1 Tax=Timema bartmani TaxID=61472 RepID=A0A7R9F9L3_9NEOP|nr:unnamed protein product [Timema bartmani]